MKIAFDILEIAVIVVYVAMVVYILWTNGRLTKLAMKLEDDNRESGECVLRSYDKYERLMKDHLELVSRHRELSKECEEWKNRYERLQPSSSEIAQGIEKEDLQRKYDELKRDYDAACGTNKEVFQENDELKEKYTVLALDNPLLKSENQRLRRRCDFLEGILRLSNVNADDYTITPEGVVKKKEEPSPESDPWGDTFEQAAQNCSKEEWEENAKKEGHEESIQELLERRAVGPYVNELKRRAKAEEDTSNE